MPNGQDQTAKINVPKEAKIGGYSSYHFQRLQESAKIRVNECEYTKNWKNVFADFCIFSVPPPSLGIVSVPHNWRHMR